MDEVFRQSTQNAVLSLQPDPEWLVCTKLDGVAGREVYLGHLYRSAGIVDFIGNIPMSSQSKFRRELPESRNHQPDQYPKLTTLDTGQHRRERRRRHQFAPNSPDWTARTQPPNHAARTVSFTYPFLPRLTPDGIFSRETHLRAVMLSENFSLQSPRQVKPDPGTLSFRLPHQVVSRLLRCPPAAFQSRTFRHRDLRPAFILTWCRVHVLPGCLGS